MSYIQSIHILKNKLGLSDEIYRALLQENFNKNSSKDLSLDQQSQLINFLNSQIISTKKPNACSYKQINYIQFLSKNTINDLSAFCSKIVNRSIIQIQELSKSEAIKVINALQRYHKS